MWGGIPEHTNAWSAVHGKYVETEVESQLPRTGIFSREFPTTHHVCSDVKLSDNTIEDHNKKRMIQYERDEKIITIHER